MEKFVTKQLSLFQRISNTIENTKKLGTAKITKGVLTSRLELLEKNWATFVETNDELVDVFSETETDHAYFKEDYLSQCEEAYANQKAALLDYMEHLSIGKTQASNSDSSLRSLPKIELPIFSGNLKDWSNFQDLYQSIILQNASLTNVERFHYLKTSLIGEPASLLQNIPVTNDNFKRAWRIITTRYENRRALVHSHLNSLMSLPSMKKQSARELLDLLNGTTNAVEALEALGRPVQHWDDWLVFISTQKLDKSTRMAWETSTGASTDPPTFTSLATFLIAHARALDAVEGESEPPTTSTAGSGVLKHQRKSSDQQQQRFKTHVTNAQRKGKRVCPLCRQDHFILFCPTFKGQEPRERKRLITEKNLCFNCLADHTVRECKSIKRCQLCSGKHHTSIHLATEQTSAPTSFRQEPEQSSKPPSTASTSQSLESSSKMTHCALTSSSEASSLSIVLATAKLLVESKRGEKIVMRALIDPCSEVSLVEESAVQLLNLHRKPAHVPVVGVGKKHTHTRGIVSLNIFSRVDPSISYTISAYVLPRLSAYRPSKQTGFTPFAHLEGLELADPDYQLPGKISLILGADLYTQILRPGLKQGPPLNPIAQATSLGWIITGPLRQGSDTEEKTNTATSLQCSTACGETAEILSRFWKLEEVSNAPEALTEAERYCEDHFLKTHARDSSGRYVVRLPFSSSTNLLGNSKSAALSQFRSLEQRMKRNAKLKDAYVDFLREYEELGHMEKVSSQLATSNGSYFLPHHEVLRESSTTTRVRVVFNASRRTTTGTSLNDVLHKGPNLLPDIFSILLRWRSHAIVFSADIEKMYRQIRVAREDCDFQRIVWRKNPEEPVSEFRLLTVTYGLACAPYLAIRVLRQLSTDEGEKYPLAASCLNRDMYVDDLVSGANSIADAKRLRDEVLALSKAGGFNLRKWASNTPELLQDLPRESIAGSSELSCSFDETSLLLGLKWHTSSDSFLFSVKPRSNTGIITKRTVFREIASLFDPLGLLAPVITTAKIFLQSLWLLKINWDDPLPSLHSNHWSEYNAGLSALPSLKIPRWLYTLDDDVSYELHGFADASERAYAAVIYLRVLKNVKPQISLVTSKTRVAPVRQVSLPRLELCAATLLVRLMQSVKVILDLPACKLFLWTDSTIVLSWLQKHPVHWKTFVANRVAEIQNSLPEATWRHVRSSDNPADAASRGQSGKEILKNKLWWKGPLFLSDPEYNFDRHLVKDAQTILETRSKKLTCLTIAGASFWEEVINKFSSMEKLCRTVGWCLRFTQNAKRSDTSEKTRNLTTAELRSARLTLIRALQATSFAEEKESLSRTASVARGPLSRLAPFLDELGIVRVGGRIKHSLLDYCQKHPIILPKKGHFVTLIIREAHLRTLHGGTQLTLSSLRQNFWILCGRRAVRNYIRTCTICWRWRAKVAQQQMGNLPSSRVRPSRPFSNSGVDYAGPFLTKTAPGRGHRTRKSYVAVFVCLATRAVHLELVSDYTTEAFLAAYRRFISRRGICESLWSDQGTNFVGADRELRRLFVDADFDWDHLAVLLTKDGTSWHFNPPAAPHFGGIWEAAVKSLKFHLRRVISDTPLTFEEFSTVLAQVEACLNSRPLVPLNDDIDSFDILTPSHFLTGAPANALPEPSLTGTPISHCTRWQLLQRMRDHFWKRWASEHLQQLQARSKWIQERRNLQPGDLCLVTNETTPPTKWPLARIVVTHTGDDGKVRVVTVRTPYATFRRPITKICLFPPSADDSEIV